MSLLAAAKVFSLLFSLRYLTVSCNEREVKYLARKFEAWYRDISHSKQLKKFECFPCSAEDVSDYCDCRSLGTKRDCLEFRKAGYKINGLYSIAISTFTHVSVFCDQTTQGGGWTVIQRRIDGSVDFYRNWKEYKHGFGNLNGEFWLGNDNIHELTYHLPKKSTLLVELKISGTKKVAQYQSSSMKDERSKYKMEILEFSGNVTDYLNYNNNGNFSTYDQDNDGSSAHCAQLYKAGWWYKKCYIANLNGPYNNGVWWQHNTIRTTFSEMKIRRN